MHSKMCLIVLVNRIIVMIARTEEEIRNKIDNLLLRMESEVLKMVSHSNRFEIGWGGEYVKKWIMIKKY